MHNSCASPSPSSTRIYAVRPALSANSTFTKVRMPEGSTGSSFYPRDTIDAGHISLGEGIAPPQFSMRFAGDDPRKAGRFISEIEDAFNSDRSFFRSVQHRIQYTAATLEGQARLWVDRWRAEVPIDHLQRLNQNQGLADWERDNLWWWLDFKNEFLLHFGVVSRGEGTPAMHLRGLVQGAGSVTAYGEVWRETARLADLDIESITYCRSFAWGLHASIQRALRGPWESDGFDSLVKQAESVERDLYGPSGVATASAGTGRSRNTFGPVLRSPTGAWDLRNQAHTHAARQPSDLAQSGKSNDSTLRRLESGRPGKSAATNRRPPPLQLQGDDARGRESRAAHGMDPGGRTSASPPTSSYAFMPRSAVPNRETAVHSPNMASYPSQQSDASFDQVRSAQVRLKRKFPPPEPIQPTAAPYQSGAYGPELVRGCRGVEIDGRMETPSRCKPSPGPAELPSMPYTGRNSPSPVPRTLDDLRPDIPRLDGGRNSNASTPKGFRSLFRASETNLTAAIRDGADGRESRPSFTLRGRRSDIGTSRPSLRTKVSKVEISAPTSPRHVASGAAGLGTGTPSMSPMSVYFTQDGDLGNEPSGEWRAPSPMHLEPPSSGALHRPRSVQPTVTQGVSGQPSNSAKQRPSNSSTKAAATHHGERMDASAPSLRSPSSFSRFFGVSLSSRRHRDREGKRP